ncbi:MAG: cytochrome c biogenesis protein [Deltaproteobacteria bacterium]|nr:cytochrome c biogenesis protein [Deltaproteobacteria bacterium]
MITLIFQFAFPVAIVFYLLGLSFYLFRQTKISLCVFLIGFISHTLFQLSRGLSPGIWLINPVFDSSYFLPWSMAAICLGMGFFSKEEKNKAIIHSMIIPVSLFSALGLFFPRGIMAPGPQHQTILVSLYYSIDIVAQACFILGAWFAVLHLREKDQDKLFNSLMVAGFILYSISQVVGAYWAYLGWALPMHWSTKHLQSASVWCYYAAVLHLRYFPTWNSRHESWFSLGGALLLLVFNYATQLSAFSLPRIGGWTL